MDQLKKSLQQAIKELEQERDELAAKIEILDNALTKLRGANAPRSKGRAAHARPPAKKTRKSPKWTPAAREAAAERMRKYWADRKKKAKAKK